jgi:hypothetical protein
MLGLGLDAKAVAAVRMTASPPDIFPGEIVPGKIFAGIVNPA